MLEGGFKIFFSTIPATISGIEIHIQAIILGYLNFKTE